APVQLTWLGYPGTTGLKCFDARLTDPFLDPPGDRESHTPHDARYTEASWQLPNTFWCYAPSEEAADGGPLPANASGFVTFASLNNFTKVNSGVIDVWSQIVAQTPNSRLLILSPEGTHRQRLTEPFLQKGVTSDRVELIDRLPRAEYFRQ